MKLTPQRYVATAATAATVHSGPTPRATEAAVINRVRDFFEAVEPLVGKAPVECNSDLGRSALQRVGTATSASRSRWFSCAQDARSAKRPFLIVLEHPPFEGWVLTGIAGRADGSVWAFHYDEGCCVPRSPSLRAGECRSLAARTDHGGFYSLQCANEDEYGFVSTPAHWFRQVPLPSDLADRLRGLTGEDPIDCGLEYTQDDSRQVFSPYVVRVASDCAEATNAAGRPFRLLLPQPGVRSTVVTGLVRTRAGALNRFRYERALPGGPAREPAFEVVPCRHPTMVERAGTADVACERR